MNLLRSVSILSLACAALSAHGLALTVATPSVFVLRPQSGVALAIVSGTLTATAPGENIDTLAVGLPRSSVTGELLFQAPITLDYFSAAKEALRTTGTYTGNLFAIEVLPTSALGLYGAPSFAYGSDIRGQPTAFGNFSITVAAPGPAAGLSFALVALRRRKRA